MQDIAEGALEEASPTEGGSVRGATGGGFSSDRVDALLRWSIVAILAAVLGLGGLFAYTVWQARRDESASTPAGRAIQDLKARVKATPNNADLRVRLGEALASSGLYKDAVEQLRAATKLNPKHDGAYLDLGILALEQKQPKTAEGYFQKVIELTAGDMEGVNQRRETAYFYLGSIALDARRYEDAVANLKAALRVRRDTSDTYYLLAQAYKGLDRKDAAMKQLEAALAFDPNYAEAHYLMGQIYLEEGDKINAAEHFRIAAEQAPDQDLPQEALAGLGTAEDAVSKGREDLKAKRYEKAIDSALLARALDPKYVPAVVLHAEAAEASGETSAAVNAYRRLLELEPNNAQAAAGLKRLGATK